MKRQRESRRWCDCGSGTSGEWTHEGDPKFYKVGVDGYPACYKGDAYEVYDVYMSENSYWYCKSLVE